VDTYQFMIVAGMAAWLILALAILVTLFYAIGLIRRAQKPLGEISATAADLTARLQPVIGNIEDATATATELAARLRDDAEGVGKALRHASDSTERMVELVEDRVAEVAALLEVVQEEAEETFLTTASLFRGLRRGKEKVAAGRRVTRAIGNLRR
jgi:ABC-type transporter Mla subunit MlaD